MEAVFTSPAIVLDLWASDTPEGTDPVNGFP